MILRPLLRYGGEEFRLLRPNTSAVRALEIGERGRAAVRDLAMPHATSLYPTISVGGCLHQSRTPPGIGTVKNGFVRMTDGAADSAGAVALAS